MFRQVFSHSFDISEMHVGENNMICNLNLTFNFVTLNLLIISEVGFAYFLFRIFTATIHDTCSLSCHPESTSPWSRLTYVILYLSLNVYMFFFDYWVPKLIKNFCGQEKWAEIFVRLCNSWNNMKACFIASKDVAKASHLIENNWFALPRVFSGLFCSNR